MSESTNAFPLDESIWEHIKHMDYTVGIPVSEKRVLNILGALCDIYETLNDDVEAAKNLLIGLAAILTSVKDDKADEVWEESVVKEAMHNFDKHLKEVIDEEQ